MINHDHNQRWFIMIHSDKPTFSFFSLGGLWPQQMLRWYFKIFLLEKKNFPHSVCVNYKMSIVCVLQRCWNNCHYTHGLKYIKKKRSVIWFIFTNELKTTWEIVFTFIRYLFTFLPTMCWPKTMVAPYLVTNYFLSQLRTIKQFFLNKTLLW